MFGLLEPNYTGTRMERKLRHWGTDAYDSARSGYNRLIKGARRGYEWDYTPWAATGAGVAEGLCCIAFGAALMYFFDPVSGRRRRAVVRDKFFSASNRSSRYAGNMGQYARDKSRGVAAQTRQMFRRQDVPDITLVERVRSAMGRVVSHPGSIQVMADRGIVTLSGPILASEVDSLIVAVEEVPGVQQVQNKLEAHETAGSVPGLQG